MLIVGRSTGGEEEPALRKVVPVEDEDTIVVYQGYLAKTIQPDTFYALVSMAADAALHPLAMLLLYLALRRCWL